MLPTVSSLEILPQEKNSPAPPAAPATNPPFFPPSPLGLYALGCGSQNLQSFSTINENRHHHQTRYARSTRCRYAAPPSCSLWRRETPIWREAISRFSPGSFGAEDHPFCGGVQTLNCRREDEDARWESIFSEKRPDHWLAVDSIEPQDFPNQAEAGQGPEAEPPGSAMDSPSHWQHNPVRAKLPSIDEEILCSLEVPSLQSLEHIIEFFCSNTSPAHLSPIIDFSTHSLAEQTLHPNFDTSKY